MKRGTPTHPKTADLAASLGIDRSHAVGILESLWHFAAQYAKRGDVGRHRPSAICHAIGYSGDPEKLLSALIETGWLDKCECHALRIHDWPEHADQAVSRSAEVVRDGFLSCYGGLPDALEDSSDPLEKSARVSGGTGYGYGYGYGKGSVVEGGAGGDPDVRAVFDHWRQALGHPDAKLTKERKRAVEGRLREGYTVAQILEAIDGCARSEFHRGQNDRGTVYDDLELICRNGTKLEGFRHHGPKRDNGKPEDPAAVAEALSWIESHGGVAAVRTSMVESGLPSPAWREREGAPLMVVAIVGHPRR